MAASNKHVTFRLPSDATTSNAPALGSSDDDEPVVPSSSDYSCERQALLLHRAVTSTSSSSSHETNLSEPQEHRGCLSVVSDATFAVGSACYRVTLGPVYFMFGRLYNWGIGSSSSSSSEGAAASLPPVDPTLPPPAFHPGPSYEEIPYETPDSARGASSRYVSENLLHSSSSSGPDQVTIVQIAKSPIYTFEELSSRLKLLHNALPVTMQVHRETNVMMVDGEGGALSGCPVPISVGFSGPVRYVSCLAAFRDDVDPSADRPHQQLDGGAASAAGTVVTPATAFDVAETLLLDCAAGELHVQALVVSDLHWDASATLFEDNAVDVPDELFETFDDTKRRWFGLLHNIVSGSTTTTTTTTGNRPSSPPSLSVVFQRCTFTPTDLLEGLLPSAVCLHATQLRFVSCPLTDAHVAAMLRRVRQVNQQEGECFNKLRVLQLSGTISADAVNSVLRFFDEEVESSVLSEVVVPSAVAQVVLRHSLTIRLPSLLVNGKSAGNAARRW